MISGSERNFNADGYQSANNQLFNSAGGYMSQGQSDNESGRLSNPQSYKLNNNMNAMNIRKVSPNQGLAQPINNISLNQNIMGGTIEQHYSSNGDHRTNLPAIVKNKSLMKST